MNSTSYLSIPQDTFNQIVFYASLFFFIADIYTNYCFNQNLVYKKDSILNKITILELLFFHHVLAFYLYFGWLSSSSFYLKLYVSLVLIVILHWLTNKDRCILTQIINWYCGYEDAEPFHDIFWFIDLKSKKWYDIFIICYLMVGLIIAMIKISYL